MAETKVNLTEELIDAIESNYEILRDDMKEVLDTAVGELETLAQDTQYDALVEFINKLIEEFDSEVKPSADSAFQNWLDGNGNYHSAMELQKAGEDAVSTANEFENSLRQTFDEFWEKNPMGEALDVDTSHPEMKNDDYDELERIFTTAYESLDTVVGQMIGDVQSLGEEDPSYKTALPAFYALAQPVVNAVSGVANKVPAFREENESLTSAQETNAENAVKEAISGSIDSENIAGVLDMFGDDDF